MGSNFCDFSGFFPQSAKKVPAQMFSANIYTTGEITVYLTIGSCFSVHYRVMEHAGSLESTKKA